MSRLHTSDEWDSPLNLDTPRLEKASTNNSKEAVPSNAPSEADERRLSFFTATNQSNYEHDNQQPGDEMVLSDVVNPISRTKTALISITMFGFFTMTLVTTLAVQLNQLVNLSQNYNIAALILMYTTLFMILVGGIILICALSLEEKLGSGKYSTDLYTGGDTGDSDEELGRSRVTCFVCWCCSSLCSPAEKDDSQLIQSYKKWQKEMREIEVATADVNQEVDHLANIVIKANRELLEWEQKQADAKEDAVYIATIKTRLAEAEGRRTDLEKLLMERRRLQTQGTMLKHYLEQSRLAAGSSRLTAMYTCLEVVMILALLTGTGAGMLCIANT